MRRRVREAPTSERPPLPLIRYRGTTNRAAVTWLEGRDAWWTANRDQDDPGWLEWLQETYDQVGDLHWCGSVGAPCGDDDCICVVWPEHLTLSDRGTT